MATIDIDRLRMHIEDYYGTAMFCGFPAAIIDLVEFDNMDSTELCEKAKEMGIDLTEFEV